MTRTPASLATSLTRRRYPSTDVSLFSRTPRAPFTTSGFAGGLGRWVGSTVADTITLRYQTVPNGAWKWAKMTQSSTAKKLVSVIRSEYGALRGRQS